MFGRRWFRDVDVQPGREAPAGQAAFAAIFGAAPTRTPSRMPVATVRTVPIVGTCLAETLAQGLAAQPILASSFTFVALPVHVIALTDPAVQDMLAAARRIVVQSKPAEHLRTIRALAHRDAEIIVFPDLVQRNLWPFDAQAGYWDKAILDTPTAIIRHHDGALARLRTIEPDPNRRFERYRALDFEEAATIDRIATAQARFQTQIDEETGTGIGAFMAESFQRTPLFYNSTHPTGALFQALAASLWRGLGMAGRAPVFTAMDQWKMWSVPVHPAIARRLGVTWATERTRYHYETLGQITWEDWVRAYIARLG